MTSADPNNVPEEFRTWVRGTGRREFEFVNDRDQLGGNGDAIPDYWFDAHNALDREGVQIAADHLRDYLPRTADAITERITHIRIAHFTRAADDDTPHIGLFYMHPSDAGPLALVGFLPNPGPAPETVPKFWNTAPTNLRAFNATIHDGFVADHWFDNGIDPIADWMTMEEYAFLTGVLDDIGSSIRVSDVNNQRIDIGQVPRPPEMGVIGRNGRHVAYMFEIDHPDQLSWSFGDDYLMQEDYPVVQYLDSHIAIRLADSS